jgi:hypothetical protein
VRPQHAGECEPKISGAAEATGNSTRSLPKGRTTRHPIGATHDRPHRLADFDRRSFVDTRCEDAAGHRSGGWPDEAHGAPARLAPHIVLSPAQKRAIYTAVSRQRLRSSAADIPLSVGAAVPRSAALLTLPVAARSGDLSGRYLKYAMVDDNVVLVDSISMRVIDIIHRAGP